MENGGAGGPAEPTGTATTGTAAKPSTRRCSPTTYLAFLLACRAVPRCASRGIGKPQDIGALPSPPGCEVELLCPRGESSTMSV
ncbi:unnamed protein product [Lampetra fluviatilis]